MLLATSGASAPGAVSARLLTSACEALLARLDRHPAEPRLDVRFYNTTQEFKYVPPQRWSKWPFVDLEAEEESGVVHSAPPGPMAAVVATRTTETSVEVQWDEYALRPEIEYDGCDAYNIETCKLCPIDGASPWQRVYKGMRRSYVLRGLDRYADVLVRVRAVNRKGPGPWSATRRFGVLVPPRPQPVELSEIPAEWWGIDIEDQLRQAKLVDGTAGHQEQMERLFDTMHEHRSAMKLAYRYYTLVGASGAKDGSEGAGLLSATQFLNFARALDAFDGRSTPTKDIDLIFKRSTRGIDLAGAGAAGGAPPSSSIAAVAFRGMAAASAEAAAAADADVDGGEGEGDDGSACARPSPPLSKEWRKARDASRALNVFRKGATGTMMAQHQFVGGLLRLASERYPTIPTISGRLHELCCRFVTGHVYEELDLLNDAFSVLMGKQPLQAALKKHRQSLERIFVYYAAQDVSLGAEKCTMNLKELMLLCEDGALIDSNCGMREVVHAFAHVNIEDDLYAQDDAKNLSTELVFDEFFEVMARIYKIRTYGLAGVVTDEGLELARGFHAWLKADLYPNIQQAIKVRKKRLS